MVRTLILEKRGLELCGDPVVQSADLISQAEQHGLGQLNGSSIVVPCLDWGQWQAYRQHGIAGVLRSLR